MIKSPRYGAEKGGRKEKEEEGEGGEENRSMCTHRVLRGRQEITLYQKHISRYC